MNRFVKALVLCAASVMAVQPLAANAAATKAAPQAAAARKLSMAEKGSFHAIHAKKAKSDCEDCHSGGPLAPEVLLVSRNQALAKDSPGPVDHDNCYDCHRQKKSTRFPAFYAPN